MGGDTLGFGKYKDRTPEGIANIDPRYYLWLCREVKQFTPDPALVKYCQRATRRYIMGGPEDDYLYDDDYYGGLCDEW